MVSPSLRRGASNHDIGRRQPCTRQIAKNQLLADQLCHAMLGKANDPPVKTVMDAPALAQTDTCAFVKSSRRDGPSSGVEKSAGY
jgi:hypothetical protein